MVSFCDIPLSQIKEHIEKYGGYGIGLTREWGQRQGLNPVLYIDQFSTLGSGLYNALKSFYKDKKVGKLTKEEYQLFNIVRYLKNYQRTFERGGITHHNYKFSDEREWRFVPKYGETQMVVKADLFTEVVREERNAKAATIKLEFEPSDIKYIILNQDEERNEFMRFLAQVKGRYEHRHVERLQSRIITVPQIREDF